MFATVLTKKHFQKCARGQKYQQSHLSQQTTNVNLVQKHQPLYSPTKNIHKLTVKPTFKTYSKHHRKLPQHQSQQGRTFFLFLLNGCGSKIPGIQTLLVNGKHLPKKLFSPPLGSSMVFFLNPEISPNHRASGVKVQ